MNLNNRNDTINNNNNIGFGSINETEKDKDLTEYIKSNEFEKQNISEKDIQNITNNIQNIISGIEKNMNEMDPEELLYSRQIAAYGSDAMNKISQLKILIVGMRGLGIEISKNIILAGVKKVDIYDNNKIIINDLSSNFYLEEQDIGQRRDEISLKKLKELNYNVECDYLK